METMPKIDTVNDWLAFYKPSGRPNPDESIHFADPPYKVTYCGRTITPEWVESDALYADQSYCGSCMRVLGIKGDSLGSEAR